MTFATDDGTADPQLLATLVEAAAGKLLVADLLPLLRPARLLIAVAAEPEVSNEMSMLLFKSADGRTGLPAFSSLQALQQWQPAARPLPRLAQQLAQDCVDHGYAALLIDLASPHRIALQGIELRALAVQGAT